MRPSLRFFFVVALSGCADTQGVRYVYQDHDFGVVGMPENTDRWPTHYRPQGEKLMEAHFAEGHKICEPRRSSRASGRSKSRGQTRRGFPQVGTSLLKVIKLGHSASRSEAETVKVKDTASFTGGPGARPKGYA